MMSPAPTVPGSSCRPAAHVRQRDRRAGLDRLLASLTPALRRSGAQLRPIFEEVTRRLVSAEHLRLIDAPAGFAPIGAATGMRGITVPVPADGPAGGMMLEAVSAPGRSFEPWELQVLHGAGLVAALLLEIERGRQSVRASGAPAGVVTANPRAAMPARWPDGAAPLIGSTPAMRVLRHKIERVAATDFTLLIEGESGTGKELVARQVHELSGRRKGPFIAVNCAAIVETLLEAELFGIEDRTATGVRGRRGKFEHAHEGTLFLDEVSDLSPTAQAKLLRAIQDLVIERVGGNGARRVDTRIVVATNRPLAGLGGLRRLPPELFYPP